MNPFLLPEEIQVEIFSFVRVRDVMNTYEAFDKEPTFEFLKCVAEMKKLPYGDSFDILTYYDEELTFDQRVEHCITTNNVISFKRLYPCYQAYECVGLLLDDTDKILIRPKIARLVLERHISSTWLSHDLIKIAIVNGDVEMFKLYFNSGIIPDASDFSDSSFMKSTFEMLKICSNISHHKEFWTTIILEGIELNSPEIVKLAIINGGDCENMCVYANTSREVLRILVEYVWNDSMLNRALSLQDDYSIDKILAKRPLILEDMPKYKNNSALLSYMVNKNLITRIEAYILTDDPRKLTKLLENNLRHAVVRPAVVPAVTIATIFCTALVNDDMDTVLQIVRHPKVDCYKLLAAHQMNKSLPLKLFCIYIKENIKSKEYCYKELLRIDGNTKRALELAKLIGDDQVSEETFNKELKSLSNPFNKSSANISSKPVFPRGSSQPQRCYKQYTLNPFVRK